MNVPPPDKRRCESCLNSLTLNLFRLNSHKCRYCEEGTPIPSRLLESNNPLSQDIDSSEFKNSDLKIVDIKQEEMNIQPE